VWGDGGSHGNAGVTNAQPLPFLESRHVWKGQKRRRGGGGWRGGGVVEPEGQQLAVHLGPSSPKPPPEGSQHPHPFPISRRWVCQTLALTARSRAEASAPHDVTRGARRGGVRAWRLSSPARPASPRLASPPRLPAAGCACVVCTRDSASRLPGSVEAVPKENPTEGLG
jgi:hypothetical protein